MQDLTTQERRTLEIIQSYLEENGGQAPTAQEIADRLGIKSRGVAHRYIKSLEKNGYLNLADSRHRNIRLQEGLLPTADMAAFGSIPLVGNIAAGRPLEVFENQDTLHVVDMFLGEGRYALRVCGDSMEEEGILDGDIVVCQKTTKARSGQIVVALVEEAAATLKRIFYNQQGHDVTLMPANPSHQAQYYLADQVKVQGVFVGLLRLAS